MPTARPKVLIFGATGLVGSRFLQLYKDKCDITTVGRSNCDASFDILDFNKLHSFIIQSTFDAVINFAAYTNVDGAEKEKNNEDGEVYKLNVLLPYYLSLACSKKNKFLHHFSTDYVFNGKRGNRPYTESILPDPIDSWYCKTKYQGDLKVAEGFNGKNLYTIIRISYPFSAIYNRKLDIARLIIERLRNGDRYAGILDQKIKPTITDDIAAALYLLITSKASGIYHIAGKYPGGFITPYQFAKKIAESFNLDSSLIEPVTFKDFSKKRVSPRPKHTWLDTTKIESLNMPFTDFEQVLETFEKQFAINKS